MPARLKQIKNDRIWAGGCHRCAVFIDFCVNLADRQDFFVVGEDRDTENENHG